MYEYKDAGELLGRIETSGLRLIDVIILAECEERGTTKSELLETMYEHWEVMKESVQTGLAKTLRSMGGLIGGNGIKLLNYADGSPLCGLLASRAGAYALAVSEVNAAMGRIVAAPTGGACGILPGVLLAIKESYCLDDAKVVEGLLVAGSIGKIIAQNATLAGAEGGCQAECGSGAAMSSGAAVYLRGGTPEAVFNAAAMVIKSVLGLVCDPVAGQVEVPCSKRNAMGAANALMAADMALAGIRSAIPFDEMVQAMDSVGKTIPFALRETGLGGCAGTPTGQRVLKDLMAGAVH